METVARIAQKNALNQMLKIERLINNKLIYVLL